VAARAAQTVSARYDLVVYGASSFVGQIICTYLLQRIGVGRDVSWAIAGRSQDKLKALRDSLALADASASGLEMIAADAAQPETLAALCARTKVVISTVGPYALYGEPMVQAAVAAGIDYCDLTGEPQWIRAMLLRYEAAAKASGARIVHACGFDSVPSDMGVWFLQQAAAKKFAAPLQHVRMRVKRIKGGASGGTVASMLNAIDSAVKNKAERRDFANPYSLCIDASGKSSGGPRQFNQKSALFDQRFNAWSAPFIMAAINTRIVFRSQFLRADQSQKDFRYDEAMLTGTGLSGRMRAVSIAGGLAAFMAAAIVPPTRWLMQKLLLPAPGDGPSAEAQNSGFFDLRFLGQSAEGKTVRAKVTGDRDPGYGSTAKMISEVALVLLSTQARKQGGFPTPSVAFGQRLLDALEAHAGLQFTLEESD
jgi:short subunit dehydrogenase-like uncharacterized protein